MKDKKSLITAIIIGILSIVLVSLLYKVFWPETSTLGKIHSDLYYSIDYSLSMIEENMDKIAIKDKDEWTDIKKMSNLNDSKKEETYSLLISDINICYSMINENSNKYNGVKIMDFKNLKSVDVSDLKELNKKEDCLKSFKKYNNLTLSDNSRLNDRMKKQINIIINYEENSNKNKNFVELLTDEVNRASKIEALTKWLKVEYDSYK